ncbi:MAG: glycosyltransferase [Phycisphaeraceae bacterium]
MTRPCVSIIMPSLNAGPFLERAICSALDQSYDNIEVFVIDGGSVDGSQDTIRLYENELTWWTSEPTHGRAGAINAGLARVIEHRRAQSSHDIIAIVNGDDLLLPGAVHDVVNRMSKDDAPGWVVGRCMQIDESDRMLGTLEATAPASLAGFLMHNSGHLPAASMFFRHSVIKEYGLFDADLSLGFEYEYACRLLAAGLSPTIMPQTLAARREHPRRRTAIETLRRGGEYIEAAQRYADCLPVPQRVTLWRNCDRRRQIYALAQAETVGGARRLLWQQLLRHPWWLTNDTFRNRLLHGVAHPAPPVAARPAA